MKMHLPPTFILRYVKHVRAKMIVHAFMIELDQLDRIRTTPQWTTPQRTIPTLTTPHQDNSPLG